MFVYRVSIVIIFCSNVKAYTLHLNDRAGENQGWTTWEIYNFVLIGLIDELIELGVSPNIKLTVLQLWAAYLSKLEVAFTSMNKKCLPKLSKRYRKKLVYIGLTVLRYQLQNSFYIYDLYRLILHLCIITEMQKSFMAKFNLKGRSEKGIEQI